MADQQSADGSADRPTHRTDNDVDETDRDTTKTGKQRSEIGRAPSRSPDFGLTDDGLLMEVRWRRATAFAERHHAHPRMHAARTRLAEARDGPLAIAVEKRWLRRCGGYVVYEHTPPHSTCAARRSFSPAPACRW